MKRTIISVIAAIAASLALPFGSSAQNQSFQGYAKISRSPIAWELYTAGIVSLGPKFNGSDYLGVGTGTLWLSRTERGEHREPIGEYNVYYCPVFLDYIHYFKKASRNSFFLGGEAGGAFCVNRAENNPCHFHFDVKCGYDFAFTEKLGTFIEMDILAGYAYGLGLTAGLRF